jgi:hypothetical protein
MPGQPFPSTRHGYASAVPSRGDISYPRYEAPPDAFTPDVQLRPSRRPVFIIGIALALIVIGIVLVMSIGGKDNPSEPAVDPGSDETKMTTQPVEQPKAPEAPSVAEDMVSLHIVSDPKGADVLIAGTKIGVTPLDTKLKRGTKVTQLTVRMNGYQDVSTKIDLGGDYSNDHIKLLKVGEEPEVAPPPAPPPPQLDEHKDKTVDTKKIVHNPIHTTPPPPPPHHETTTTHHETAPSNMPKCQPPGPNVDPFSTIPVCPK